MAASVDLPDLVVYVAQDCTGESSTMISVFDLRCDHNNVWRQIYQYFSFFQSFFCIIEERS